MNTSIRARHAARGFSMIELLITTVIAGIVFAGMVPLFVTVLGKNSADNVRNISAFIAQDKIERLRQLDYMEITPTNLASSSFKNAQFGNTVAYQTGSGTKTFNVTYTVATLPTENPGSLTEQYKEVSVDVYWTGPPAPVKHVYQVTRIYRQYAGPSVTLDISPAPDADGAIFDPAQVVLTATVPAAWAGSSGVAATSKVTFSITLLGVPIKSQDVLTTDTYPKAGTGGDTYGYPGNGQYKWTWAGADTATLGLYKFTAVGYSSDAGSSGEETGLYANLDSNIPDAPTGLTATPGPQSRQVSLAWDPCANAFFDHFAIYRSTTSDGFNFSLPPLATTTENAPPTYVDDNDRTLVSGTKYYYCVKVVALKGGTFYPSLPCAQVSAIAPYALADDTAKPSVSTLTATKVAAQPTINLTWTASVDNLPVAAWQSGLASYAIYRSPNNATPTTIPTAPWVLVNSPLKTATSWADTSAGYSKTWYYCIVAYDAAGNWSISAVKSATTDAMATYTLTVTNKNKTKVAYVWVKEMVSGLYYSYTTPGATSTTPPASVAIPKSGATGNAAFKKLPSGSYQVFVNFTANTFTGSAPVSATGSGPYVCTVQ